MASKIAALPGSFMAFSVIGFFISTLLIAQSYPSYGFAFALVFVAMFVASIVSMTHADLTDIENMEKKK